MYLSCVICSGFLNIHNIICITYIRVIYLYNVILYITLWMICFLFSSMFFSLFPINSNGVVTMSACKRFSKFLLPICFLQTPCRLKILKCIQIFYIYIQIIGIFATFLRFPFFLNNFILHVPRICLYCLYCYYFISLDCHNFHLIDLS